MCGIVGILSNASRAAAETAVRSMVAASAHRGPNGNGQVTVPLRNDGENLVLGHTRLSILDLTERANQPMQDPRSGSWLVYNGEIYNFRQLRCDLEGEGVRFVSDGDTEVVLQALVTWGTKALRRFDGMFAVAFYDGAKRELLLARDSLGIKPLYYFQRPGLLMFASEVKGLRASNIHDFVPDPVSVDLYLRYGAVPGPRTIFEGVKEVPAGSYVQIGSANGSLKIEQYWSFAEHILERRTKTAIGFDEAVQQTDELLRTAVGSHLVSDVPVGVFLSGGIDSSLLAFMVPPGARSHVALLTVGFSEEGFSEVPYAREVAQLVGMKHEIIQLSTGVLRNLLPDALAAVDQPTVDGINTYVISHVAAQQGLKVLLSGLGGDELFGGYTTFWKVPRLFRHRQLLRLIAPLADRFSDNSVQWAKIKNAGPLHTFADAYLLQRSIRWRKADGMPSHNGAGTDALFSFSPELLQQLPDDYARVACLELQFYMRNQLLRDSDVFSMANSMELRVPFLDLPLVKAALNIPGSLHFDSEGGKRITRHILDKVSGGRLTRRKKMGFTFPWATWLRGELGDLVGETLRQSSLYDGLAIPHEYGQQLLNRFQQRDPLVSWFEIWSLFVLLNWHSRSMVTNAAAD